MQKVWNLRRPQTKSSTNKNIINDDSFKIVRGKRTTALMRNRLKRYGEENKQKVITPANVHLQCLQNK